jgi:hypothetical protein
MLARFVLAAVLAIAAAGSAPALIPGHQATRLAEPRNETVIEKNQAWPVFGPIIVEECANETCEDIVN